MWRQIEAELIERLSELSPIDRAATILIEVSEDPLPVLDVFP